MISPRYHVLSLAAVFLALAVGVVFGSAGISGRLLSGLNSDKHELGQQVADLESQRNALGARLADADRFGAAVGPLVVRGRLDQRTVTVVTTADANSADRDAVAALLHSAGATVSGELALTAAFTDPAKSDQLRELVIRLLPAGVQLPSASDPGTLAGGLLGALLLLNRDNNQPRASAEETAAALAGLASGGFVRPGQDLRPGQLAVILTGSVAGKDAAAERAARTARFAVEIGRSGAATVLAGRSGSADGTGPIGVVRADTAASSVVSTVDDLDTSAGRAVTVLALRERLDGRPGHYGTAGNAQGAVPAIG